MNHRTGSLLLSLLFLLPALRCLAEHAAAAPDAPPASTQPAPAPKPAPEVQAMMDRGDQAAQAYRWREAEALYRQALENARALQDRPGEAEALANLGSVFYRQGQ